MSRARLLVADDHTILLNQDLMPSNEVLQGASRRQGGDLIPRDVVEIFDALMQHGTSTDLTEATASRHGYVTVGRAPARAHTASTRLDAEHLQELGGRVPLDSRALEVVVIRPHRKVQREREGKHIDVIRIAFADSAPRGRELALVL